jgi:hypothetical protein
MVEEIEVSGGQAAHAVCDITDMVQHVRRWQESTSK